MRVSEPATKQDLDEAMGVLRDEMTGMEARLRGEMTGLRGEMTGLRGEMTGLRGEMTGLRGEMTGLEARLRSDLGNDMKAMEERLGREIGAAISHATNVMMEEFRRRFAALDDKYGDLRPRQDKLRADLDTHTADVSLHVRRPAAPGKQTRRPRSR